MDSDSHLLPKGTKKATVEELAKTAGVNIDTARELKEIIDEM